MKATSKKEAWTMADRIFPTDYIKDDFKSNRAGYPIYTSTINGLNAWICDLGNRLEVNLENGQTINIWIEKESKQPQQEEITTPSKEDIEEVAKFQPSFKPSPALIVTVFVENYKYATTDAHRTLYKAMRNSDDWDRKHLAFDVVVEYCKQHNIKWCTMSIVDIISYNNDKTNPENGHYVIRAAVIIK